MRGTQHSDFRSRSWAIHSLDMTALRSRMLISHALTGELPWQSQLLKMKI